MGRLRRGAAEGGVVERVILEKGGEEEAGASDVGEVIVTCMLKR